MGSARKGQNTDFHFGLYFQKCLRSPLERARQQLGPVVTNTHDTGTPAHPPQRYQPGATYFDHCSNILFYK